MTTILPDKPSELIRLALADLEKAEESRAYSVDMGMWHGYDEISGKCTVCLAGAVMAGTLGVELNTTAGPGDFWEDKRGDDCKKLYWLNDIRIGNPNDRLMPEVWPNLPIKTVWNIPYPPICSYNASSEGFHRDMKKYADWLEKRGL